MIATPNTTSSHADREIVKRYSEHRMLVPVREDRARNEFLAVRADVGLGKGQEAGVERVARIGDDRIEIAKSKRPQDEPGGREGDWFHEALLRPAESLGKAPAKRRVLAPIGA